MYAVALLGLRSLPVTTSTSQLWFSSAPTLIPILKVTRAWQFITYIPVSIDVLIQSPGAPLGPHPPSSLCTSLQSPNQLGICL